MKLILVNLVVLFAALQLTAASPLQDPKPKGIPIEQKLTSSLNNAPYYRLENQFSPENYKIQVQPLLDDDEGVGEQYTAPGNVVITVLCNEATNMITLHSNLLEIDFESIRVTPVGGGADIPRQGDPIFDLEKHFMTLTLESTLTAGNRYEISMSYVAPIATNKLDGLYLSKYIDPTSGEERRLVTTQFQATNAREMFPCFDEPGFKATFDVTIIHKENYTSTLSNTPLVSDDEYAPGWRIKVFGQTPPMSTYLLTLLVSDYAFVDSAIEFDSKPVKTWGPPHMIQAPAYGGNHSADAQATLLNYFQTLFDISYSIAKMDSVALPDFEAGAMEEWGLNTYRLLYLLYFEGESVEYDKHLVTLIVAHEISHQWFGNMISCHWWSDLWVNEGFANYLSYFALQSEYPEYEDEKYILNDGYQVAMMTDASSSSHPVINDAVTPAEVDAIFSRITYQKGGALIRMMHYFLGFPTLQKGLQTFLAVFENLPVDHNDLLDHVNQAAEADGKVLPDTIQNIMHTYMYQIGYPLVRVSAVQNDDTKIYVSQERWRNNEASSVITELDPNDLWFVPISVVSGTSPPSREPTTWLNKNFAVTTVDVDTNQLVMINFDAAGYYRVMYDTKLLNHIKAQLETDHNVISPMSRSQLLDDYFELAFQNYINLETALDLTKYLAAEEEFVVWDVIITKLRNTFQKFSNTPTFTLWKEYFLPRIDAALTAVGVEQDQSHAWRKAIYRSDLMDWACGHESSLCADYAAQLLTEWEDDLTTNPIHVDVRATMECAIVSNGNSVTFRFIYDRFEERTEPGTWTTSLRNALTCSQTIGDISQLLSDTLDISSSVHSSALAVWQRFARNSVARPLMIQVLESSLETIIDVIGGGSTQPVASIVSALASYANSASELSSLTQFVEDNAVRLADIRQSLDNSLAAIENNIGWVAENAPIYDNWFQANIAKN